MSYKYEIDENKMTCLTKEHFPLEGDISDCSNVRFPKDYLVIFYQVVHFGMIC